MAAVALENYRPSSNSKLIMQLLKNVEDGLKVRGCTAKLGRFEENAQVEGDC